MAVLIGTSDSVFHTATVEDAKQVLNSGDQPRVREFPTVDGVFAAMKADLESVSWRAGRGCPHVDPRRQAGLGGTNDGPQARC